ncbi:hypothetical protein F5Y03DRAFT_361939, partial [Xylaria venustula]
MPAQPNNLLFVAFLHLGPSFLPARLFAWFCLLSSTLTLTLAHLLGSLPALPALSAGLPTLPNLSLTYLSSTLPIGVLYQT